MVPTHQIVPKLSWKIQFHAKFIKKMINASSIKQVNWQQHISNLFLSHYSRLRAFSDHTYAFYLWPANWINIYAICYGIIILAKTFERGCLSDAGSKCANLTRCLTCTGNGCNSEHGGSSNIPIDSSASMLGMSAVIITLIGCLISMETLF